MPEQPLLVDGHEDLAYNMLTFGRDYSLSVEQTRQREQGSLTPERNGDALLGWPEYQQGRVAVVFATLFAAPERARLGEWDTQYYRDSEAAHRVYSRQLDTYEKLVEAHPDQFVLLRDRAALEAHVQRWRQAPADEPPALPVGLVILMENAEGVRSPQELAHWWARGVRIIGPAWTGTRFCGGTREPGPLTKEGFALLAGMAEHGFVLDVSHMDEPAVLQALDEYPGVVIASHSNARSLLPGTDSNRHLTDRMIQGLLERQAVIGVVPANGFLKTGWKELGGRAAVSLDLAAAQIDYICQLAGNATHVAIGSDYDGGFGLQSVPVEVDSVADLQKLVPLLQARGYHQADINLIFHGNWLRVVGDGLP
jgi:membrane dipeptidase